MIILFLLSPFIVIWLSQLDDASLKMIIGPLFVIGLPILMALIHGSDNNDDYR